MKGLLLLLVVAMIFSIGSGFAESEFNLSDMDDEQLLKLHIDIEEELAKRDVSKNSLIYPGLYEVGVDIPEGYYNFIYVSSSSEFEFVSIFHFKKLDDYKAAKSSVFNTKAITENGGVSILVEPGSPTTLLLTDGMVVLVDSGVCFVEKVEKPTWAK